MCLSEAKLPRDLLPKKSTFGNFSLAHMFLDQKTKVNFTENQKVPGLLIPSTRQFHVQVQHNLYNLNLVINTSGQGHKNGSTEKNANFRKKIDQILRDLEV